MTPHIQEAVRTADAQLEAIEMRWPDDEQAGSRYNTKAARERVRLREAALLALVVEVERDAIERCAKAQCEGCRLGASRYADPGEPGGPLRFHRTRQEFGYSADLSCAALAIRALIPGDSEGVGETPRT